MKTIVIYYSVTGQTEFIAKKIAAYLECDILQIQTDPIIKPDVISRYYQGGKSMLSNNLPKLKTYQFNADCYDNIVLGCPTWGGNCPPAVKAFIGQNHFDGKHLYLFTTYITANASRCLQNLSAYFKDSTVKNKVAFSVPTRKEDDMINKKLMDFYNQLHHE